MQFLQLCLELLKWLLSSLTYRKPLCVKPLHERRDVRER